MGRSYCIPLSVLLAILFVTPVKLAAQIQLFALHEVQLHDSPFRHAQEVDLRYILSLDEDRLLFPFYREAGIAVDVKPYGNWENTGLDGHMGGHYLSALALMYASTKHHEVKSRLDKMVSELAKCQAKNPKGYVGGVPNGYAMWEDIRAGKINADNFSLNGKWVPLYNIHKLFAGLYDAHVIAGNKQAGEVFFKLCDWFAEVVSGLTDEQVQQMLKSEHGGMNEVFALASELSGNREYAVVAEKLSHRKILSPLLNGKDSLTGLHANTQIPKVIGFKKIGDITGKESWTEAADFFWHTVVEKRSVSIGGNSVREHFHPVNDFSSMISSNQGPETCNTYNMLRLTKSLFMTNPSPAYIDYYERALYNHILSSQHPDHGGLVYFTSMRPRHYRVYSSAQESFWCCVGSGIENHGKYGELIYAHSGNDILVNLFIPSTLTWKERNITLTQTTRFPFSDESMMQIAVDKPSRFALKVRHPGWVKEGAFRIEVNGKEVPVGSKNQFTVIDRLWKNGDKIKVKLPMRVSMEMLPDGSNWGSFTYGPVVLAAVTDSTDLFGLVANDSRMGHVAEGKFLPVDEAPVIVKKDDKFLAAVKPVPGKELTFSASSLVYPSSYAGVELVPFFQIHDSRYMIYWLVATPSELGELSERLKTREAALRELKARTIDEVVAGEQQPEVEHGFKGDSTSAGMTSGRNWRTSNGWFSYELRDPDGKAHILRVVYEEGGNRRNFKLLVNNVLLKAEKFNDKWSSDAFTIDYPIPPGFLSTSESGRVIVKFDAEPGFNTGRINSVHLLKKE